MSQVYKVKLGLPPRWTAERIEEALRLKGGVAERLQKDKAILGEIGHPNFEGLSQQQSIDRTVTVDLNKASHKFVSFTVEDGENQPSQLSWSVLALRAGSC